MLVMRGLPLWSEHTSCRAALGGTVGRQRAGAPWPGTPALSSTGCCELPRWLDGHQTAPRDRTVEGTGGDGRSRPTSRMAIPLTPVLPRPAAPWEAARLPAPRGVRKRSRGCRDRHRDSGVLQDRQDPA